MKLVSADASEGNQAQQNNQTSGAKQSVPQQGGYRALVALGSATLEADGKRFSLTPGMQVTAEINLGTRTVMEYLLSPVQKAVGEAGRER